MRNKNWHESDKVYEEMPDAIMRILFHYIRCKVIYSYKDDTKILTSVCNLEWEGI